MSRRGAIYTGFCKFAHRVAGHLRFRGSYHGPARDIYQDDIRFAGLGLKPEEIVSGGRLALICSLFALLVFVPSNPSPVFIVALVAVPVLVQRAVLSYPATLASRIEKSSLREAPEIMCYLIGGAGEAPTHENAVISCAVNSRGMLKGGFERMIWSVYTKGTNIPQDFEEHVRTWKGRNQGYEESLQRFFAAARLGRLDDPSSLVSPVHRHSRRKLKEYLASLKTPVNVVFALGIALPVMIASMLPLTSLASAAPADVFASSSADDASLSPVAIAVILDIVFPLGMFLYCREVLSRRPLSETTRYAFRFRDFQSVAAALVFAILLSALVAAGMVPSTPIWTLVVLVSVTSAVSIALIITGRRSAALPESRETTAMAFECLGDLLQSGESLETALLKTAELLEGTNLGLRILNDAFLVSIGTGQVGATLASDTAIQRSPLFGTGFSVVANVARKDLSLAGSIAKSISADLRENLHMEAEAKTELRSVVQTVNSTLTFFSPIVLGITAAMFLLIEGYMSGPGSLTSSVFLMILGTLICCNLSVAGYFTEGLQGGDAVATISRIGKGLLIAMPIFVTSFLCGAYFFDVL